jgi:hypothetical protein
MMRNGSIIIPKGRDLLFIQQFAERKQRKKVSKKVSHGFGLVASPRGERSPPQVAISPSKQERKKQRKNRRVGFAAIKTKQGVTFIDCFFSALSRWRKTYIPTYKEMKCVPPNPPLQRSSNFDEETTAHYKETNSTSITITTHKNLLLLLLSTPHCCNPVAISAC